MKNNQLSKNIRTAVQLFAEFGQRGHYEHKGRVIIQNDVIDPSAEGIFLARCARKIAKREGVEHAYDWALEAFGKNIYHKLNCRNAVYPSEVQIKEQTRRIELGLA